MQKLAHLSRYHTIFIVYNLFLSLLLIGCGGTAVAPPSAASTRVPTAVPALVPTASVSALPTSTLLTPSTATPGAPTDPTVPIVPSGPMQLYTGNGITMEYPQTWKANPVQNQINFTDPSGNDLFMVAAIPSSGAANIDLVVKLIQQTLNVTAVQDVQLTQQTFSLAGESWAQRGFTGTIGGERDTFVIAATTHKAKIYILGAAAPIASFQQINANYFTPMAATLKFTP